MTIAEIRFKAEPNDKAVQLNFDGVLEENDYLEWSPGAFTSIEKGSEFIGKHLNELCFNAAPSRPRAFRIVKA